MLTACLLFVLLVTVDIVYGCDCGGVEIASSDQKHCYEVIHGISSGWIAADDACQAIGGHLAHPQDVYDDVISYVKTVYQRPIHTGIVSGNPQTQRYGLVCPNNVFYDIFPDADMNLIGENATTSASCAYITNTDYKLHFGPCTTDADVLCDRPMEKDDYCNIKMTCNSTTTTLSTTILSTLLSSYSTSAILSSTSIPSTSGSPSTTTNSTTPTSNSTSTTTTTKSNTTESTIVPPIVAPITVPSESLSTSKQPTALPVTTTTTTTTTTSPTTTTTKSAGATSTTTKAPSCDNTKDKCGKNEWRIFGMCIDWRLLLILLALLLSLCGLCWCLHCCLHCCMLCRSDKQRKVSPDTARPIPLPVAGATKQQEKVIQKYEVEPVMNPPAPIQAQPVMVSVPNVSMPSPKLVHVPPQIVSTHTREMHMIHPEKPNLKDVGTMTEPWPVATAKKQPKVKKVIPKPKRKLAPIVVKEPFVDDIADDVSIVLPRSPSPDNISIAPTGDIPVVFKQNPKPGEFDDQTPTKPLAKSPPSLPSKQPAQVISMIGDPTRIRSPPARHRHVVVPHNARPKTYAPISDESDNEGVKKNKFPSPPPVKRERREPSGGEGKKPVQRSRSVERPSALPRTPDPPRRQKSPGARNQPSETPIKRSPSTPPSKPASRPSSLNDTSTSLMKQPDVSMRRARGKLGGVVRGGGTEGQAPTGWKPWANNTNSFSNPSKAV